jgi:hypothetical protein
MYTDSSLLKYLSITRCCVFFLLYWNDEIIETKWQQCGFTDLKVAKLGVHDVWIPNIYVRNTASIAVKEVLNNWIVSMLVGSVLQNIPLKLSWKP